MNRDHSVVFETASNCCISDSFVAHDGYCISSDSCQMTSAVEERKQGKVYVNDLNSVCKFTGKLAVMAAPVLSKAGW